MDPFDPYIFLVNPQAGQGAGRVAWPKIEAVLEAAHVPYEVEAPASAAALEARALEWASHPARALVVVGGDGSLHHALNGLMQAAQAGRGYLPLGLIPVGTHNDFAQMVGLPVRQPIAATRRLLAGTPYGIDVGLLQLSQGPIGAERFFVVGVGVGLLPHLAPHLDEVRGRLRYLLALAGGRGDFQPHELTLTVDGVARTLPATLLIIGNGARHLGELWLTPDAELDDGELDLCLVRASEGGEGWGFLLRAMRGRHLGLAAVSSERVTQCRLSSRTPQPLLVDGELVPWEGAELSCTILPSRLPLIL